MTLRVERLEVIQPPVPQYQVTRLEAEADVASATLYRVLRLEGEGVVQVPAQGTYRALRLEVEGSIVPYGAYVFLGGEWRICTIYVHRSGAWEML